jgi:hypothetical protein
MNDYTPNATCGTQKFHPAAFNAMQHCYILIVEIALASNVADFKGIRAG